MGKNNRLTAGDVMTVIFSTLMAVMSVGGLLLI